MSKDIDPGAGGLRYGKLAIILLFFTLIAIILYKNYAHRLKGITSIPKEMQINYMPSDFKADIDEEDALAILSNPYRYRREFNQLVYDLNLSILHHVANRMDLSDSLKSRIQVEYDKHHPYLRNLYFNDFIALKDTTSSIYQTWYDNESTNSVDILKEVASKYTCFLVNHVMTNLVQTKNGSLYAKGKNGGYPVWHCLRGSPPTTNKTNGKTSQCGGFQSITGVITGKDRANHCRIGNDGSAG